MTTIDESTRVTRLRSEYPSDLIGLPGQPPLLSWTVSSQRANSEQLAYELQASSDSDFATVVASALVQSGASQFILAPGDDLRSREVRFFRVRIKTAAGWTGWSSVLRHEAGLLHASDFKGLAIGDRSMADGPVALLRTSFEVTKPVQTARIYATAHGVFNLVLNGQRVSDDILAPGWTSYWHRLLVVTHDVTDLLQRGRNVWGVELGDGWFRSKLGFVNTYNLYGDHSAFLGQLEVEYVDGSREVIATGKEWLCSTAETQLASIYDGSTVDLRAAKPGWATPTFDASSWSNVTVRVIDKSTLEPRCAAPVRVIRESAVDVSEYNGAVRIDAHQNIAGWLRLTVQGTAGTRLTLRHAEILEPSGALHTKALRGAKAIDVYTLADDQVVVLEPRFTFHGFQFADIAIEGDAEILDVQAIAISSEMSERGSIETSHPLLNKLLNNIYWSLRDNFVSLPTDCPQRDERMGWTGDAQVIAYAAHTMVDDYQFFKSWLKDLALEQLPSGEVPVVVPDILAIRFPQGMHFSKPTVGWGDAATFVPWSMYERFGDIAVLADQLHSMREWVRCLSDLRVGSLIPATAEQLGDWLDPDAPPSRPADSKVNGRFMANSYLAYSALILSRAEQLLGHERASASSHLLYEQTRDAVWAELAADAATTPTGAAVLLLFELAPGHAVQKLADDLAASVVATEGRIRTGFLGTPLILDAMSRFGHLDEAYVMLLRTKIRSWLYPVTMGATTMWERWEAIREDGSIDTGEMDDPTEGSEGSMISFNHYAYGAVADWVYRNVGGLAPRSPGYRDVTVSPRPHRDLTSCIASIETGYGTLAIDWTLAELDLDITLVVPFGTTAVLDLPVTSASEVSVNGTGVQNGVALGHGEYRIFATAVQVAGALSDSQLVEVSA